MIKLLLLVLISILLLTACGAGTNSSDQEIVGTLAPVPAEYEGKKNPLGPDSAEQGASVFKTHCEICHGSQGHGDGLAGGSLDPKPKNLAVLQEVAGDDYLFWRISEGHPGTAMVAWNGILSEEQIWDVISFIRTLKK